MTRASNLRSIRDPLLASRLTRVWRQVSARLDAIERAKPHSAPTKGTDRVGGPSQGEPARQGPTPKLRQPGAAAVETPEYSPARPATTPSPQPAPRVLVAAPPRRKLIDLSAVPSSMKQQADKWGKK